MRTISFITEPSAVRHAASLHVRAQIYLTPSVLCIGLNRFRVRQEASQIANMIDTST